MQVKQGRVKKREKFLADKMREKPFDSIWDSIIEFGETDGGVKSNLRIPKRVKT